MIATTSGRVPLADGRSRSAPASTRIRVICRLPSLTAKCKAAIAPEGLGTARALYIPGPCAPMSPDFASGFPEVPSGVSIFVWALMSAPRASSRLTTSEWFSKTAHISAVCPRTDSLSLIDAPRSSRSFTASTLPLREAVISAVSPPGFAEFGSTPARNNSSIIAALPFSQAK